MYHAHIEESALAGAIAVARCGGVPAEIDRLAEMLPPDRAFLRAAWYGPAICDDAITLVATRPDRSLVAAIPTTGYGPPLLGVRNVPGSYWPFRSLPIAPEASEAELAGFFAHPLTVETLGQLWRIGPVYADDPVTPRIKRAAARAGWTVLVRQLGQSFLFDTAQGWPRGSTRRRLANYTRQLAQQGALRFETIHGSGWNDRVLDALAAIESASWVGRATDGTGAKFIAPARRGEWRRVLADPVLAEMLAATILWVDETPAAFSFDLVAGKVQYAIASSYDERYAAYRPGKLVTASQLEFARARGVEQIDFGAGDSGYKREMGATHGPEILDLLLVRHRSAASLLKLKWGRESDIGRESYLAAARLRDAGRENRRRGRLEALLAVSALAAAAISAAE